jgi:uncharacterized protein (TIGR02058 family)
MVLEIGMGTDIRGTDYTKAAVRALRDALWHNSLSVAAALGQDVDSMQVEVHIGVPKPDLVDKEAVLAVLPHGTGTVKVVEGGLEIPNDEGTNTTVIANAAAVVRLDVASEGRRWPSSASSWKWAPATTCTAATIPRQRSGRCRMRCTTPL